MQKKIIIITILACLVLLNIKSKIIIWDLQNIIFKTSNFKAFLNIGLPTDFLSYRFNTGQKLKSLQSRTFDVLEHIKINNTKNLPKATENGRVLPLCMRSWLAGLTTGQEIINQAPKVICELDSSNFFYANIEKKLIYNTIVFMFNPNYLPYAIVPMAKSVRLLKKCFENNNQMLVLSNWASDGFDNLYNNPKNREVFKYFNKNNIVISGNLGIIKPDTKIFKYLINKYNLNPADCIFIDNDILNINSAKKVGMNAILVKDRNISKLTKDLKKLKVI